MCVHAYVSSQVIVLRDDLADDQLPAELAPLLFEYCNTDDEGIRGIIAHCLGALCNDGETVRRALTRDIVARIRDPSPRVRWVIIGALRYVNIDKGDSHPVQCYDALR